MVIRLHIKKYKFILGTYVTIFKDIRRIVWKLQELYSEDDKLRQDLETTRKKILDLKDKIQKLIDEEKIDPKLKEEVQELKQHLDEFMERFDKKVEKFAENIKKQIKKLKKADFDGQALVFKELREVEKVEKNIREKMQELNTSAEQSIREDIKTKVQDLVAFMEEKIEHLNKEIILALKHLWNYANRQAIGGTEAREFFDTETKEKLTRVIKVDAKESKRLIDIENKLEDELDEKMSIDRFKELISKLFSVFLEEIDELKNMSEKLRIYSHQLEVEIREIAKEVGEVGDLKDKNELQELNKFLSKSKKAIENHYRWIYHEAEEMLLK